MMGYRGYDWDYGGMMGGGWGGGILMMLFDLLLLVGLVLLIVWAVRMATGTGHSGPIAGREGNHDDAVALARRRLANGDITCDEFDNIMKSLHAK